jgi:hypothetical protein
LYFSAISYYFLSLVAVNNDSIITDGDAGANTLNGYGNDTLNGGWR